MLGFPVLVKLVSVDVKVVCGFEIVLFIMTFVLVGSNTGTGDNNDDDPSIDAVETVGVGIVENNGGCGGLRGSASSIEIDGTMESETECFNVPDSSLGRNATFVGRCDVDDVEIVVVEAEEDISAEVPIHLRPVEDEDLKKLPYPFFGF